MKVKDILVAVLVLFLMFLLFGGRVSGYGEPCGGSKGNCIKGNGWCSEQPLPTGKTGTCQKDMPIWVSSKLAKKK